MNALCDVSNKLSKASKSNHHYFNFIFTESAESIVKVVFIKNIFMWTYVSTFFHFLYRLHVVDKVFFIILMQKNYLPNAQKNSGNDNVSI